MSAPDPLVRFFTRSAECLLWVAEIEEREPGKLIWSLRIRDEEAAQRVLPLEVAPQQTYTNAWIESRLPEDHERMLQLSVSEIRAGRSYSQTFRCRVADGTIRWLHENVQVEPVEPGRWHAIGICTDVTEHQEALQRLRRSEERLRQIFDCPLIGLMIWNEDGSLKEANDALLRIIGYTREDLEQDRISWREMTPAEFWPQEEQALAQVAACGSCTPFEKEYIRKDGTRVPVLVGGNAIQSEPGNGVAFVLSLQEAKRADVRLRQVVAGAQCLLWHGTVQRLNGKLQWSVRMFAEEAARRFLPLNQPPGERYDQAWYHSVPREDREEIARVGNAALEAGLDRYSVEYRSVDGEGRVRWFSEEVHVEQKGPDEWELVGVATDVTARKRAEQSSQAFLRLGEALNRVTSSEAVGRTVLDVADGLFGWDACWLELAEPVEAGRHTLVSMDVIDGERKDAPLPGPELAMGPFASWAVEQGSLLILRDPDEAAAGELPYGDTGRASASIMVVPIRMGETVLGALSIQSYTHYAYSEEDLTMLQSLAAYCAGALKRTQSEEARRLLESQLLQAQKMEAVGRLAGGVAHDFNNMLAVISGYTSILLDTLAPDNPARSGLKEISAAGERAAALTRQLLAYSRKQIIAPRVLDLNELVRGAESLLRRLIGEDITVATELGEDIGRVRSDPTQLEQVLVNLVVNARDAMPAGGSLYIRTDMVEVSRAEAQLRKVEPGPYAVLSVRDTGVGMAPDVVSHIFEPFYTTKQPGHGTGLGLSTVYGIVQGSGGFITVESTSGEGSTLRVFLPGVPDEPPAKRAETPAAEPGSGTILLVEDERMVRQMTATVLRMSGYEVLEAANGKEALEAAREYPGKLDLLLTDVVMPGMNGREAATAILKLRPGTPVLFMSGYTDDAVLRAGVQRGTELINKPFTPTELTDRIQAIITAHEPESGRAR